MIGGAAETSWAGCDPRQGCPRMGTLVVGRQAGLLEGFDSREGTCRDLISLLYKSSEVVALSGKILRSDHYLFADEGRCME